MADRTVRAIFEARVSGAQKGMRDLSQDVTKAGRQVDTLSKDLSALDKQKVSPDVDVKIDEAKKRLADVQLELADLKGMEVTPEVTLKIDEANKRKREIQAEIKELNNSKAEVRVQVAIGDAERRLDALRRELGDLRTQPTSVEVDADIREAQRKIRATQSELRDLRSAKATMKVDADTKPARDAIDDLSDDIGDAGAEGGDEAGENIVAGILSSLKTIPIAGAVIGVGAAIAGGILLGIKQGLAIEAERDLFSAQTGLDEATANRFGRAAGEAYAQAWGDSVASNLDIARRALSAGIIDSDATDAEIENVIAKVQALNDLFEFDVAMSVQGIGNLMKTGLVKDANQAFDLIVAASQKLPSDDLLETLNEYSNQFTLLGLTGEQAFGLIVQGAQAGARDTDKVADAVKEFGISMTEGADDAVDALDKLGLSADDIFRAVAEGGPGAADALGKVFTALRELEAQGGDTKALIEPLFGSPGEDLGAALYALNLDTVTDSLGGVEGAAGAADRALETMADNAATDIESARRNIEIAMDGIKGALAAAFSDDITAAAEWVQNNRAPLLEFFLFVINGAFNMGRAFVDFAATALTALADVVDSFSELQSFIDPTGPIWDALFGNTEAGDAGAAAGRIREQANSMRTDVNAALDGLQADINDWALPEIMAARVADATRAMTEDLDAFSAVVESAGGTITINGDTMNAEEAYETLVAAIDGETGTVTIDGNPIPAEDVLAYLIRTIGDSGGEVTVGAEDDLARDRVRNLTQYIDGRSGTVSVKASTSSAEATLREFLGRPRSLTVGVRVAGVNGSVGGLSRYDGGWLPGRYSGGWVPGKDVGYDNVLWPLYNGGRTLQQPLGGGEFVVNSRSAADNAALLEFINSGGRFDRGNTSQSYSYPLHIQNLYASQGDAAGLRREAEAYRATRGLGS